MSALEELFPNATARPWRWDGVELMGPAEDAQVLQVMVFPCAADAELLLHAVNTYDARDIELQASEARFLQIADILAGKGMTGGLAYELAIRGAKGCEAARAVKP